jgi:hypothetical protein
VARDGVLDPEMVSTMYGAPDGKGENVLMRLRGRASVVRRAETHARRPNRKRPTRHLGFRGRRKEAMTVTRIAESRGRLFASRKTTQARSGGCPICPHVVLGHFCDVAVRRRGHRYSLRPMLKPYSLGSL